MMAKPHEKLAASLASLRELQNQGRRVFKSSEFSRTDRTRLLQGGFLQEVMKGWLISSNPSVRKGDTTPWYASFWEFCGMYSTERFGKEWHLSPEQSLLLLAENTVIPTQAIVYSPKATNNLLNLAFGTSLYELQEVELPSTSDLIEKGQLRLFSPNAALVRAPEAFYIRHPIETQVILASLPDASDILRILLNGGHSIKAGQLAGAFRRIGRPEIAEEIVATMRAAHYEVRATDPFLPGQSFGKLRPTTAPIIGRMQAIWESMRESVMESFPESPALTANKARYLQSVDDIYEHDAYNSLSIEGYSVSAQLIEKVRKGDWDPDNHDEDRKNRDALAARGYWQAFQAVKINIQDVIEGANAGELVRTKHKEWYRELFQPSVVAGLLPPGALAGYRNEAVYLRTSRYVPPRWEAVREAMPALFDLLQEETQASVRAVLGHWLFGYIHPYPDGNGRMARFLMNVMLASGGYPWTVIRVEDRAAYLEALDLASINMDVKPFSKFIAQRVQWSLENSGALAKK